MMSPYRVKVTSHRPCVTSLCAFGCWFTSLSTERPAQLHKTSLSQVGVTERDGFTIQPELKAGKESHHPYLSSIDPDLSLLAQFASFGSSILPCILKEKEEERAKYQSCWTHSMWFLALLVSQSTKLRKLPWIRWNHSSWVDFSGTERCWKCK